ncbi:hypothetical protein UFOVP343_13 [uncultured Caudovirales phage]|uniref:Uncharacterized protein n=1 Tax=uncultured Caudovirales phage TaxID=2100421 RepID=A0A6J5M0M3_9CAUD|nr:hypothetical protein UFOVP343_13 [uncultured Caudovirales phage]
MKKTLLSMVQSILSDMDSEAVNSIGDSVEAQQIASVIEDTYFNIIAARDIPEHRQLLKLTSLSSTVRPTHFQYPTNTRDIVSLSYNIDTSGGVNYQEIYFVEPLDFLSRMPAVNAGTTLVVPDVNSSTSLVVFTDRMPTYYTSFDDLHIVMNAYAVTVDTTLQESKTRSYGTVYPTFTIADSFTPDLDDTMMPYLLAEAKSTCFSLFKSGSDPKIEQAARRLKSFVQNDMYRTKRPNVRNHYGRN